jgi:hypothetical protein
MTPKKANPATLEAGLARNAISLAAIGSENNLLQHGIQGRRVAHSVELLRDAKGVYGVGIAKEAEIHDHYRPSDLILRPDRLWESKTNRAALQMITGGFRHGMFSRMSEESLRRVVHHGMLRRAGFAWPPRDGPGLNATYWSLDREEQTRNRKIYHGLRLGSLAVVNRLISKALEEAADQQAVALARRFRLERRYRIYRAATLSHRVLQLTDAFPVLGLVLFANDYARATARVHEAARLIEAGAPLNKIAQLMRVPIAFRKVKPAAADLALSVIGAFDDQRLVHTYMPDSLPKMKLWLRCINLAKELGSGFVQWTAEHALEIGGSPNEALSFLRDIMDWVTCCYGASVPRHILKAIVGDRGLPRGEQGEQFVVRRFSPDMSLATVTRLSGDWHEAIAANISGPNSEFPEPWCPAGEADGFEIVPIINSAELYREGRTMHHCVGAYESRVRSGECYFFSVRKDKERVATLELLKSGAEVAIGQLRGACNREVAREVVRAVKSWLRSQREFRFPPKEPSFSLVEQLDDDGPFHFDSPFDSDIPF